MNGDILRKDIGKVEAQSQCGNEEDCAFQNGEPGVRIGARDGRLGEDIVIFLIVHDSPERQP